MVTKKRHNPITLADVARKATVSIKTASRVLNEESSVSSKTAARVRTAMARLGYQPNELARGLKSRRSTTIGIIVKNLSDPFVSSAVKAVARVASANGFMVVLASSGGNPDVERSAVENLIRRQVDGLVISPIGTPRSNFADLIPAGLNVITLDQPIHKSAFDSVMIDNRRSSENAVQHLLSHGYRRIVALGILPHLHTTSQRIAGYRDAMQAAGVEARTGIADHEGMITPSWIRDALFDGNRADAVICMNWVCTMSTLRGLKQLHKCLIKDVAFLSFDDFDLADTMTPTISAVRQPTEAFGYESARLLFERIKGEFTGRARSIILPTELILRESCGCSPGTVR